MATVVLTVGWLLLVTMATTRSLGQLSLDGQSSTTVLVRQPTTSSPEVTNLLTDLGSLIPPLNATGVTGVPPVSPVPIQPVAYSLSPPPLWVGPLQPNEILTRAERVHENLVVGPESIVQDGEYIYTGTADARIVTIHNGEVRTLARLGKLDRNCGTFDLEPVCGRPLGMRMDRDGYLLVADAYLGIFRINRTTGAVVHLLSSKDPLDGQLPTFFNDVEESPNASAIYFTVSSTKWDRRHNRYLILEGDSTGRLMSLNPATLAVETLAGGLMFANGLAVSYDGTHILVVETSKARILRYHIQGDKKGQVEVFADSLPGWPDNVRRSGRGTYWVGFASVRRADKFSMLDYAASRPTMRSDITKTMSREALSSAIVPYGLALELDKEGAVVRTLHDPTGKQVPAVSEVDEKDGVLTLGSYYLPFLSRVQLERKETHTSLLSRAGSIIRFQGGVFHFFIIFFVFKVVTS